MQSSRGGERFAAVVCSGGFHDDRKRIIVVSVGSQYSHLVAGVGGHLRAPLAIGLGGEHAVLVEHGNACEERCMIDTIR